MVLAWIVLPDCPIDLLCAELERIQDLGDAERLEVLLAAQEKKWIKLVGAAEGNTESVAMAIRESLDAEMEAPAVRLRVRGDSNGS
jgi:hypothetical protein